MNALHRFLLALLLACSTPLLYAQMPTDSLRIVATAQLARAYDAMYTHDYAMALALLDELGRKPEMQAYRTQILQATDSVQCAYNTYNCHSYCQDAINHAYHLRYRKAVRALKAARRYAQTDVERESIRLALKRTRRARNRFVVFRNVTSAALVMADLAFWGATYEEFNRSTTTTTSTLNLTDFFNRTIEEIKRGTTPPPTPARLPEKVIMPK